LGDGQELVYSPLTCAAQTLSAFDSALVQSSRTFAPLQEHVARICRENNLGPEQGRTIREHLHAMAQSGLLTSRADLMGYFRPRVDPLSPARPIAVFGVPTRDRVQSLARCLRSYLEYDRHYGRTTEYVVIDGSHGPDTRQANRQLLRSLADYYGAEVSYA